MRFLPISVVVLLVAPKTIFRQSASRFMKQRIQGSFSCTPCLRTRYSLDFIQADCTFDYMLASGLAAERGNESKSP